MININLRARKQDPPKLVNLEKRRPYKVVEFRDKEDFQLQSSIKVNRIRSRSLPIKKHPLDFPFLNNVWDICEKHSQNIIKIPEDNSANNIQFPDNGNDIKSGTTYFSPHPPIAPLQLVYEYVNDKHDGPVVSQHIRQLIKNIEQIKIIESTYGNTNIIQFLKHGSDEGVASYKQPVVIHQSEKQQSVTMLKRSNSGKRITHDVRLLLHQLITNLPMYPDDIIFNQPQDNLTKQISPTKQSSPQWRSLCNIAVQAFPEKCITLNDNESAWSLRNTNSDQRSDAEEWMGGVRALRDSHVRLVLKQLRHIERLNHALDHITKTNRPNSSAYLRKHKLIKRI